jgi:hypothetical protein
VSEAKLERTRSIFAAATANRKAEPWNIALELHHGGDVRTLNLGHRPRQRGYSLRIDMAEAACDALLAGDVNAFWARAAVSGRFSHFAVVSAALFDHVGGAVNEFAGAATVRESAATPGLRRGLADEALRTLHRRFSEHATARIAHILRMWTDEEDFAYEPDRLTDYVIPDAKPRAWFDNESALTSACVPHLDALRGEARQFCTGEVAAEGYYAGAEGGEVPWGRMLLFAYDRPVPEEARRRFPATMACMDAAAATGRLVNACFLTMIPGHELLPHSDGNACFASWHLGLVVPEGCALEAGREARSHREGAVLAFDDSYTHSAWNRGERLRVVVSGWSIHPDLREDEAEAMVALAKSFGWGI